MNHIVKGIIISLMPTDKVKLLAIIYVLNVPENASQPLCTAC